jgi:hypothetical protein
MFMFGPNSQEPDWGSDEKQKHNPFGFEPALNPAWGLKSA